MALIHNVFAACEQHHYTLVGCATVRLCDCTSAIHSNNTITSIVKVLYCFVEKSDLHKIRCTYEYSELHMYIRLHAMKMGERKNIEMNSH